MSSEPRLSDLQMMIARFRDERDWRQFHMKDPAAAIAIEAGELQEEFSLAEARRGSSTGATP
jgi:hypothetical protein